MSLYTRSTRASLEHLGFQSAWFLGRSGPSTSAPTCRSAHCFRLILKVFPGVRLIYRVSTEPFYVTVREGWRLVSFKDQKPLGDVRSGSFIGGRLPRPRPHPSDLTRSRVSGRRCTGREYGGRTPSPRGPQTGNRNARRKGKARPQTVRLKEVGA